jgi:hypothetical protein
VNALRAASRRLTRDVQRKRPEPTPPVPPDPFTVNTSPIWAFVGIGVIVLILAGLFYVFRTYGRR